MSTDIQTPDFSLNVRYSKADKKNGAEKEDSQVIIYEDKDTSKHRQADLKVSKYRITTKTDEDVCACLIKYWTTILFFHLSVHGRTVPVHWDLLRCNSVPFVIVLQMRFMKICFNELCLCLEEKHKQKLQNVVSRI